MTPTIVYATWFSVTRRPTIDGSPPSALFQKPSVMITAGAAFARSSSSVKSRPSAGLTPMARKKLPLMRRARIRRAWSRPVSVCGESLDRASVSNEWARAFQSK
jgi:hypothetical protein